MKIRIDTHTHSLASGHAYSTIDDLARGGRRRGLVGFVLTDHGPALPGGTHPYHFGNLRILPPKIGGLFLFRGVEANIMDDEGTVDLKPAYLRRLDFVLAGFHEACFPPRDRGENTRALIAALGNPWVDGISHPGNPLFPVDYEAVVRAAAESGKALEINNSSFRIRPGSAENCRLIALLCGKYRCPVSCGSDAHYRDDVGNFTRALALIRETALPPELVINRSLKSFREFSQTRLKARQACWEANNPRPES
jgi:putative hydrolase